MPDNAAGRPAKTRKRRIGDLNRLLATLKENGVSEYREPGGVEVKFAAPAPDIEAIVQKIVDAEKSAADADENTKPRKFSEPDLASRRRLPLEEAS